jgi:uncharacterized damage-inducible protein DinB
MKQIFVYIEFWEYLRFYGLKTIELIESEEAWNQKLSEGEFTVLQTFNHTVKSIFEDAGTWFLKDSMKYEPSTNPKLDLSQSIDRMIQAIQGFDKKDLNQELIFQWGDKTTVKGAIRQNIFHAVSHFGQLRERVGLLRRSSNSHKF